MRSALVLVFVLVALALVAHRAHAICWTAGPYHVAAGLLATGIGNISSSAVCVYGVDVKLNGDCPLPCKSLITATWGDCYCRDPNYKPDSSGADPLVKPMSVQQMFYLLATPKFTKAAYCRDWLAENIDWKC